MDGRNDKFPEEYVFMPLPSSKNDTGSFREKGIQWADPTRAFAPEGLNSSKAVFSPVLTPKRAYRALPGESVWRTSRPREVNSAEKRTLGVETPNYKLVYQCD